MGAPVGDRLVASRLGHRGPGPVRLLDADLEVPPLLGKDRVRQRDGPRGPGLGGATDRGNPRTGHPQPATALDEPSAGELGHSTQRLYPCHAGAGNRPAIPADRNMRHQHRQDVQSKYGALDAGSIGTGLLVRPALLGKPVRSGDYRRPSRDVGGGLLAGVTSRTSPTATASRWWWADHPETGWQCHGRDRKWHGGGRAGHRDGAVAGAEGRHRGLRGRNFRQFRHHVRRLQPDRQRRHGQDRERELDERMRGVHGHGDPALREHASSRRRPSKGNRSSSPRATRVPRAATSTG